MVKKGGILIEDHELSCEPDYMYTSTNSEFISLLHLQGFSKVLNVSAWSQLCTTGALREDSSLGQKIKEKATLPEVSKGFPWEK